MMVLGTSAQPKSFMQPVSAPIHYYIYSPVSEEISEYAELIHHLDIAQQGEELHIHLATPGGSMETAIAIVHAIMRSNATVIAHADATVASAGTIIFLACTSWCVYEYASFMFHDGSIGTPPMKFNESKQMIDHVTSMYSAICHDIYGKIMTEDEINSIVGGKDCYMKFDEMVERLTNYTEELEKLQKEESEKLLTEAK